jgi:hypothetical protein
MLVFNETNSHEKCFSKSWNESVILAKRKWRGVYATVLFCRATASTILLEAKQESPINLKKHGEIRTLMVLFCIH